MFVYKEIYFLGGWHVHWLKTEIGNKTKELHDCLANQQLEFSASKMATDDVVLQQTATEHESYVWHDIQTIFMGKKIVWENAQRKRLIES